MADSNLKAELTADASQFVVEMARAEKANQSFMTIERLKAQVVREQERAVMEAQSNATANGEKLTSQQVAQINRTVKAWTEQSQRIQYTKADFRDMQAAQAGISGSTEQMRAALAQSAAATDGLGHSSAGARREMLVLAHEASQGNWKNFAGSILVLGERMDALALLTNPVTLGIAAMAGAGYVAYEMFHSVTDAAQKFNDSLKLTNNWAGLTNDTAALLAATIAKDVGTSFDTARQAVDATAASGAVLGVDMQTVTEIALLMAKSTGDSFDKTLASVAKQQDGVSQAAINWQDAHHDMDAATLEHIKTLDEAGDHTTALRILYAQELATMKKGTETEVGQMKSIWDGLLEAWNRTKRTIAGTDSLVDQRATLVAQMNDATYNPGGTNTDEYKKEIAAIDAKLQADAQNKASTDAVAAAKASLAQIDEKSNELLKQGASNEEKRTAATKAANDAYAKRIALSKTAGVYTPDLDSKYASDRDRQIADAARMYADPKQHQAKAYTDDAATRMLQSASETQAALKEQLGTSEKIGTEQEKQIKFEQMIADLKTKKTLTADQKSLLANQATIDAVLQQNTDLEKQKVAQEAINKLKERAAAIDAQIGNYQQSQNDQYQRQLSAIGMGQDAVKQAEAVKSIYAEYQKLQFSLEKQTPVSARGGPDYAKAQKDIQDGLQQSLKDYTAYYAELKAKQSDWTNGASAAMADYLDDTANRMKQTETLFHDVTNGMEDAWVTFAQTGKISFTSLANSVIADLARMQAKAAISGLLGSLASIGGSLGGDYFSANTGAATTASNALSGDSLDNLMSLTKGFGTFAGGGVISGPGTGTSDSIPILVSNGESILTAAATNRLGESGIEALNNGASIHSLARYASGGVVGRAVMPSSSNGGITVSPQITVEGGSNAAANQSNGDDLNKKITAAVRAVVVNERKQGGALWKMKNGIA